jgi:hypothetical protein
MEKNNSNRGMILYEQKMLRILDTGKKGGVITLECITPGEISPKVGIISLLSE